MHASFYVEHLLDSNFVEMLMQWINNFYLIAPRKFQVLFVAFEFMRKNLLCSSVMDANIFLLHFV